MKPISSHAVAAIAGFFAGLVLASGIAGIETLARTVFALVLFMIIAVGFMLVESGTKRRK